MTTLLLMITMINTMMMYMKHPMSMGVMLIIQTMIVAMVSGMFMKTFWMSYILLITMLSGMLVLFMYMSSIASNEKFMMSMKMMIFMMITMVLSMLIFMMKKSIYIMFNPNNLENTKLSNMNISMMMKMFNNEYMFITMLMIGYLLLTMIVSTNIVKIDQGPMRMKTYE